MMTERILASLRRRPATPAQLRSRLNVGREQRRDFEEAFHALTYHSVIVWRVLSGRQRTHRWVIPPRRHRS
jgi:hypothetical protein